jgi:hypothetical protein
MDTFEIRQLARAIVAEMDSMHNAELASKWEDGVIIFKPAEASLKAQEMPIEKLMHKIVMIRDNLRVLEQQINSCASLPESEKIKFQSYITKCYGSLTSFNFIFYKEEDKF